MNILRIFVVGILVLSSVSDADALFGFGRKKKKKNGRRKGWNWDGWTSGVLWSRMIRAVGLVSEREREFRCARRWEGLADKWGLIG